MFVCLCVFHVINVKGLKIGSPKFVASNDHMVLWCGSYLGCRSSKVRSLGRKVGVMSCTECMASYAC